VDFLLSVQVAQPTRPALSLPRSGYHGYMTTQDDSTPFQEVPPSQAPQLVPSTEDSNFLSPGGAVAGIAAFADSATSPRRSKAARVYIRIVVALILLSLVANAVWHMGGGLP
jgi:hypothetical protein